MKLHAENLSVSYGTKKIVKECSFVLEKRQFVALVGPNGAGKSTLLKALSGLLPHEGEIRLAGATPHKASPFEDIAYMPQDTSASSVLTVMETVLLGRVHALGLRIPSELMDDVATALASFGITHLANATLAELSGGQRQLVFLAQALFRSPSVLLLDEPTAALDLRHQLIVLDAVRRQCHERGIIAVMAVHDLSLAARYADRILCLSHGHLAADDHPAAVLTPERLREVYGVEAEVSQGESGYVHVLPLKPVEERPVP